MLYFRNGLLKAVFRIRFCFNMDLDPNPNRQANADPSGYGSKQASPPHYKLNFLIFALLKVDNRFKTYLGATYNRVFED